MTLVPAFELSISKQETSEWVDGRTQAFRFVLVASSVRGFRDAGVFRFRRVSDSAEEFEGVCSPADMYDFALDAPDDQGVLRRIALDLIFASKSIGIETMNTIMDELKVLCDEMAKVSSDLSPIATIPVASDAQVDV